MTPHPGSRQFNPGSVDKETPAMRSCAVVSLFRQAARRGIDLPAQLSDDEFVLLSRKTDALGASVPAIALAAHTTLNAMGREQPPESMAGVLRALHRPGQV
jgi:hypothetical protein